MKYIFYFILSLFVLVSCKTSKPYLERSDTDNTLYEAIKALKKNNNDTAAANALPVLYSRAKERHLRKVNSYSESKELSRWDKTLDEYNILQNMHDAIIDVDGAAALVTPANYQQTMYDLKQ